MRKKDNREEEKKTYTPPDIEIHTEKSSEACILCIVFVPESVI